ncbi:flagellar biosynthesis repressor FlbT [Methylobacterium sp. J-077]|uniref:flagellar biosynthesis repressor FlbT n=1 Tax=Methylobacterium sp. J-077 TaxID=2836656 RepID=UPI001FBA3A44|nr:flagellar biosynthesis repressor FlbT [Methylobacterium sp. J-077]MCJ2124474.1 flagellar biosynthesis repressor FlbT [Methylobacterium sp. J-077]
MGLRLSLKPYERLIINGAAIRNGDRPVSFLIENQCKFLRESEIMHESDADTDCKKLCVTLQVMYLVDEPATTIELFLAQARELIAVERSFAPYLLKIQLEIEAAQYYKAIKQGRELIAYERSLLDRPTAKTNAA